MMVKAGQKRLDSVVHEVHLTTSKRTAHAAVWALGGKLVARGFDFISLIVLARLLLPGDFGLVGMAMTVILIAEAVFELPIFQALIRVKYITPAMFNTAFTLSAVRGAFLGIVIMAMSWPMSVFFADARLVPLICVLAFAPILRGLLSPRMVLFSQQMDFRREAALDVLSKCVALIVSSAFAYSTRSYWSIVAGTLGTTVTLNAVSFCFAPYRPRFSLAEWPIFKNMVGWNSLSQLLSAANWQMDRFLLGRYISQDTFGKFTLANDLTGIPFQALVAPLSRPIMAAFSVLDGDANHGAAYCKASNAVLAIVAPVYLIMAVAAEPLVRLVLGDKWIDAVPLLRALALISMISLPAAPMGSLAMALDKARLVAVRTAAEFAVKLPLTIFAVAYFGVNGAIWSRAVLSTFILIWSMATVSQLVGVPLIVQATAFLRTIAALCVSALVAVCFFNTWPKGETTLLSNVHLLECCSVTLGVYVASLFICWQATGRPDGIEATAFTFMRSIVSRIYLRGRSA